MNITILKNALEKYLCATESDDEKLLCAKALEELTCVMDRYENADCWDNDAVLLPADSWVDILDAMTYDILGERLRMHGDNMHPEYYYYDVRKQCAGLRPSKSWPASRTITRVLTAGTTMPYCCRPLPGSTSWMP